MWHHDMSPTGPRNTNSPPASAISRRRSIVGFRALRIAPMLSALTFRPQPRRAEKTTRRVGAPAKNSAAVPVIDIFSRSYKLKLIAAVTQSASRRDILALSSRKLPFALVVVGLASAACAQNPFDAHKQFSATMVMTGSSMGSHAPQGDMKVYRLGDQMRTNIGSMAYSITDLSQHTMYMVMGQGMCMQMTPKGQQNPFAEQGSVERTPVGTDVVDGHTCKVENVIVTPQNGMPTKMKVWEATDLQGFPVKVEVESSKGPVTVMYKDVSFDAPAASLFTHPDNCRQMPTMPGGPQ